MSIHDCPTCTCVAAPGTCWTCEHDDTLGGCDVIHSDVRIRDWTDIHCRNDEGMPSLDAPPCPGFKAKEST